MRYIYYRCCDHCFPDPDGQCVEDLIHGGHRDPCKHMCETGRTPIAFMEEVLAGRADLGDVDEWISWWHRSPLPVSLHEFLGLTFSQYSRFVQDPTALEDIVNEIKGATV